MKTLIAHYKLNCDQDGCTWERIVVVTDHDQVPERLGGLRHFCTSDLRALPLRDRAIIFERPSGGGTGHFWLCPACSEDAAKDDSLLREC